MKEIKQFDAIIIGFGKGGKTLSVSLGNAGKRTALIEKSSKMYGGTCINVGCIPTKFLAHKARDAKNLKTFTEKQKYYKQVIEQELILTKNLREKNLLKIESTPNVTVFTGFAKIKSTTQVEVTTENGIELLEGKQIFFNTGAQAIIPPIEGVESNPHVVTSETLLTQSVLPENLVIIGGGYIGVEFASMYADFGSKVTVIQNGNIFLPREDRGIATAVYNSLESRGVCILTDTEVKSIKPEKGKAVVEFEQTNVRRKLTADTVLIATGRKPNIEGLGLENVGVAITKRGGIVTDEHLRTTVSNIYAMGDVVGDLQFTYISLDDFRIVRSAVLGDGSYTTGDRGVVPYSVFVNPPFSRVGMSEQEAKEKGYSVKIARLSASAIPKALVMEQPTGLLKAIIDEKTGMLLGVHLFCEESHEMISIAKFIIDKKLSYTFLRDMIFTHPTMSEAYNDLLNV